MNETPEDKTVDKATSDQTLKQAVFQMSEAGVAMSKLLEAKARHRPCFGNSTAIVGSYARRRATLD